jgi:hypothetical protein
MTLNRDQARRLALANGMGRCALGLVAFAAPGIPLGPWVGEGRRHPAARLLARALGARDFALGLGAILALRHEGPVRGWVEAGGMADAGDVVVTIASFGQLPRVGRWGVLAAATGGVVSARLAAPHIDSPS